MQQEAFEGPTCPPSPLVGRSAEVGLEPLMVGASPPPLAGEEVQTPEGALYNSHTFIQRTIQRITTDAENWDAVWHGRQYAFVLYLGFYGVSVIVALRWMSKARADILKRPLWYVHKKIWNTPDGVPLHRRLPSRAPK